MQTKRTSFIAIFGLLLLLLFAAQVLAQGDPCQVITGIDDLTGDKKVITICDADIGGEMTETPTPVGTPTPVTPGATPTPVTPGEPSAGIWISVEEVRALPQTGGWSAVLSAARGTCTPDVSNQDSACNVTVQAQSLAWARTGDEQYRQKVVDAITKLSSGCSSVGGRTLALGRELGAYIVAADLVNLRDHAPATHLNFQACLRLLLTKPLDGMTIVQMFERRPNNWGTMGGSTLAALYAYLGDKAGLDRVAKVFCGWLGNRSCYSGFTFGDISWQCNSAAPVGVNPVGCIKGGHDIGGALPDDMRRGGAFKMPNPAETGYACGAQSGSAALAWILHRAGYPAFEWENRAVLRARQFLERIGWECVGDDDWLDALLNSVYGTKFAVSDMGPGKNMGWTQWTHAGAVAAADVITIDDQRLIATGESPGDLQDEVEYQAQFGWLPVGDVYEMDSDDGRVLAQDMEHR